jgi:hypothetical protein
VSNSPTAGFIATPTSISTDWFVRTVDSATVPDTEYARLTLAMGWRGSRSGFDALCAPVARSRPTAVSQRRDALLTRSRPRVTQVTAALVVDTRSTPPRSTQRSATFIMGAVDDRGAVTEEQRIGAGDVIVTRRNNPDLGVANREAWTARSTATATHCH